MNGRLKDLTIFFQFFFSKKHYNYNYVCISKSYDCLYTTGVRYCNKANNDNFFPVIQCVMQVFLIGMMPAEHCRLIPTKDYYLVFESYSSNCSILLWIFPELIPSEHAEVRLTPGSSTTATAAATTATTCKHIGNKVNMVYMVYMVKSRNISLTRSIYNMNIKRDLMNSFSVYLTLSNIKAL